MADKKNKSKLSNNPEAWLINWFSKNSSFDAAKVKKRTAENYFDQGWIDSFKFINLVSDAEKKFKLRFSNDEFQNRKFTTIKGLASIIAYKINAKK
jgi:acyl carrier protein